MSQGFGTVKVKVGTEPGVDIDRVRAVRQAVGDTVRIGVDANGGWSAADAVRTIRRLEDECDIAFAEQPVSAANPGWMAEVRRSVGILAVGGWRLAVGG